MELTINTQNLENIVIKSASGELYRIVREDDLKDYTSQLNQLIKESRQRIVTQQDVLKIYGIGHARLKEWVAQGLSEIHDGGRVYYDLKELYEFLNEKKI